MNRLAIAILLLLAVPCMAAAPASQPTHDALLDRALAVVIHLRHTIEQQYDTTIFASEQVKKLNGDWKAVAERIREKAAKDLADERERANKAEKQAAKDVAGERARADAAEKHDRETTEENAKLKADFLSPRQRAGIHKFAWVVGLSLIGFAVCRILGSMLTGPWGTLFNGASHVVLALLTGGGSVLLVIARSLFSRWIKPKVEAGK